MKYILLIYENEKAWNSLSEGEQGKIYAEYRQLGEQLRSNGKWVTGSQLAPTNVATSVRVRDGKELITDGPFAETREQLGGFYLIDAKNLDEANAIAAKIPSARTGTIEVRPLIEHAAASGG